MHRIVILSLLLLVACGDSSRTDSELEGRDTDLAKAPNERAAPGDRALRKRLKEETITFSFEARALPEALDFIRLEKSINVVIDDRIRADLEDVLVTLGVTGLEVESTLELLLRIAGPEYTYVLRQGVVFVTERDKAATDLVLRVHPVGDLTGAGSDFVAPNLILEPAGAEIDESQPLFGNGEEEPGHRRSAEELRDLIVEGIEPGTWEGGEYRITVSGEDKLVVVHTPGIQARVARFLENLR